MKFEPTADELKAYAQKINWLLLTSEVKRLGMFDENTWVTPSGNIMPLIWTDDGISSISPYVSSGYVHST